MSETVYNVSMVLEFDSEDDAMNFYEECSDSEEFGDVCIDDIECECDGDRAYFSFASLPEGCELCEENVSSFRDDIKSRFPGVRNFRIVLEPFNFDEEHSVHVFTSKLSDEAYGRFIKDLREQCGSDENSVSREDFIWEFTYYHDEIPMLAESLGIAPESVNDKPEELITAIYDILAAAENNWEVKDSPEWEFVGMEAIAGGEVVCDLR